MKKIVSLVLALVLVTGLLSGCGAGSERPEEGLHVVVTIFPIYDWTKEILGDDPAGISVTMLLDSGADLHSYQPTARDILDISQCDLFICVGGESDGWVDDALAQATNENMIVIRLLDVLADGALLEEASPDEAPGYDEHVWLSLKNASVLCGAIEEALAALDPEHGTDFEANLAAYREKLAALDQRYQEMIDGASRKTLVFGDRFPFRYLAEDYGLKCYAAFSGCSAETEASFETILELAGRVDEFGLPCVMKIEGSTHRIAETVVDNTAAKDQSVLVIDSMQSVTMADVEKGVSYLSLMEKDLEILTKALQ